MTAARIVMITGAAGNLGQAVVRAFTDNGDHCVLVERHPHVLKAAFGDGTENQTVALADLLDADSVAQAVRAVLQQHERIDVLCNLAGGFAMGQAVHEIDTHTWDGMLDLNSRSVVHTARAVVPAMIAQGRGAIVNIGANVAQRGQANMGAYIASKAAVMRLTESMAAELREHAINVNCVMPSIIDTPQNRSAMPDADPKRWVAPEDLAQVILFLASDAARAIHGAAVPVVGLS